MAVVGSPSYFAKRPPPRMPQDLTGHDCINLRLPAHRGVYAWEFERSGRELRVRVDGQLMFNTAALILNASLAGFGLAYLTEQQVQPYRERTACPGVGQLVSAFRWLSPLLSQPPPAFGSLCSACRRAPVSRPTAATRPVGRSSAPHDRGAVSIPHAIGGKSSGRRPAVRWRRSFDHDARRQLTAPRLKVSRSENTMAARNAPRQMSAEDHHRNQLSLVSCPRIRPIQLDKDPHAQTPDATEPADDPTRKRVRHRWLRASDLILRSWRDAQITASRTGWEQAGIRRLCALIKSTARMCFVRWYTVSGCKAVLLVPA